MKRCEAAGDISWRKLAPCAPLNPLILKQATVLVMRFHRVNEPTERPDYVASKRLNKSMSLRSDGQIKSYVFAGTADALGIYLRQNIDPAVADRATKAIHKFLEGRYHWLEVVQPEICPWVKMYGPVDAPLLHAHRGVARAKELSSFESNLLFV
jgi:hypothetical protein